MMLTFSLNLRAFDDMQGILHTISQSLRISEVYLWTAH